MSSSEGPARVSVLVVDDSALMRRLITDIISEHPPFHVVGTARNGREALQKVHRLDPDVVTLDVEMPEVDGLQALGYIMSETPRPVVMLSAHTREGGEHTLRALDYGAVDFVAKPSGTVSRDVDRVAERLIDALRAATQADLRNLPVRVRPVPGPPLAAAVDTAAGGPATACVVVAASTGGPRALVELFAGLRLPQEVAVLTVQHMPGGFTRSLAGRLNAAAHLAVAEGEQAGEVRGGRAYLAPGGFHMRVEGRPPVARLVLGRDASMWGVRPAADPLFATAVEAFGERVISVVLSGMGRDGALGTAAVVAAGGTALAQDRGSAVIASMPRAAIEQGAEEVLLPELGERIAAAVRSLPTSPAER
jgi:two-component system, chemotaxis family, protein-glutamate methylesterase/glutaminase